MKKLLIIITGIIMLSGCGSDEPKEKCSYIPIQEKRQEIFRDCLDRVAKIHSDSTHYSDLDEVVDECDNVAYYQSKEKVCIETSNQKTDG